MPGCGCVRKADRQAKPEIGRRDASALTSVNAFWLLRIAGMF